MSENKFRVPIKAFALQYLGTAGYLKWIPDELYLKMLYKFSMGVSLNLENPRRYTEKLQWIKLYDRRPEYTMMVDKYAVRRFVTERIGEEYLIPLLGVWDSPDDINFNELPDQFVMKCNHDSGGIIICKDKSKLDFEEKRRFLKRRMKQSFFWAAREWPYKNIPRKVIAEKYMEDESGYELKDYKFFCFDGKCKAIFIATDRGLDTRFDFYDPDFNHLPIKNGHENAEKPIVKPDGWEKMIQLAETLSEGIPQVRVDLYNIYGRPYFGEMTLFHYGGKKPFEPDEWDYIFGEWIHLHLKRTKV